MPGMRPPSRPLHSERGQREDGGQGRSLFKNISWGTDAVLAETLNIAAERGLSIDLLDTLSDVDRPEDLKHINHHSDL